MKSLLWVTLLLTVAGMLILRADSADAHAALVSAEPAENAFLQRPPGEITLVFSEPLAQDSSTIRLLDSSGRELELKGLSFSPDRLTMRAQLQQLPPGIYNVLWSNVSTIDGHALRGAYPFTVLQPDGTVPDDVNAVSGLGSDPDAPPQADGVAVRALSLFGLLLAAGPVLLVLLGAVTSDATRRALTATVVLGVGVLGVATLLNLELIRDTYAGRSFGDLLVETRAGNYWIARFGAVLFIAVLTTFLSEAKRVAPLGVLLGVAVYLWGYTATSHAAASTGNAWAQGLDFVHGVAAVVWIGAVIGVAVVARTALRGGNYRDVMPRFSLLASVAVFVLVGTGILSAFIEIDRWQKLIDTRYGVTLLVKLGLMALLLVVALYNARWGKDRLLARGSNPRPFIATVTGEALLGLAVFAAAAVLTQSTVAKGIIDLPDAEPFNETTAVNEYQVALDIDPNRTGVNTYRVQVERDGAPAADAQAVRLTFRYLEDETVGPARLVLASSGEGAFVGQGPYLTLEGRWRVEVEIRRSNADDMKSFFDVRPAGAAVNQVRIGGAWDNPAPGLDWNQFGGLVAVIAGLGLALFKSHLWRIGKRIGWVGNGATAACFGIGALLLFGIHSHGEVANVKNPIFPDQNSIAIGRELYQQDCAVCHGPNGVPPEGLNLNPYPLDLTVHVPQHPDGQIFAFIDDGVPGSAMRAWGEGDGSLTEEQIWHVVNYLRTLGPVDQ
ncbi:MAG: copper resistance protein CopC [Dehalococcoidia bacterium]|nr:copper resistance protein CopC [Dehalococcoidia bacterium]